MGFLDEGGPGVLIDPEDGGIVGRWGTDDIGASPEISVEEAGRVYLFQYVPQAMRLFDRDGNPLGRLDYADSTDPDPETHEQPWGDEFWPAPVFPGDGFGYSASREGLVRIEVTLP